MQAGDRVDKYILERKLGEGGMAQVWMARHIDLGKLVAIKCLSTRLTTNPEFEQRFLSEGRRQAGLRHPNIVEVVDFLVRGDDRFLVMEFVEGESVSALQKRRPGPLPLDQVASISLDIASALDHAHKRGLIHRDVKPSNILLDEAGKAYLTDFGIALAVGEDRLTRTGMAVGTVHYMSPEQIARPREIDLRTDIYSFGCVLYDMLTGRPPFVSAEGDTDFTVMNGHLTQPPPPIRTANAQVPEQLEAVVLKCLAKDPNDRYANAEEMGRALRRVFHPDAPTGPVAAPQIQAPAPAPVRRGGLWVVLVLLVVVLGGSAAAFYLWSNRAEEPPPVVKQEPPPPPETKPAAAEPPPVQPVVQPAVQTPPVEPAPAPPKPVARKVVTPPKTEAAPKQPSPAELRMKACRALGLTEEQCLERLKQTP